MIDPQNLSPEVVPPVALTIAGSDSGGGAGIAADLHTFAAHHVFGTLALTAITAQNTEKVHDVVALDPLFVAAQIDAVTADFSVRAAKTGMLATTAIVDALAARAEQGHLPPLVVDPVMVSSTGSSLLEGDGRAAYYRLLAHALVATPNLREAEVLLGRSIESVAQMSDAARQIVDLGVRFAVVKGGHLRGADSVDVVFDGQDVHLLHATRIDTNNTHGTGCTLSAAITANLALGHPPLVAISDAKIFVTAAIQKSITWKLGGGVGPIDNWGSPSPIQPRD